jgi:hypothetical protein
MPSRHRVTQYLVVINTLGISIRSSMMGIGAWRVVFPFKVATSGPKIFSAISTSYVVTGLFLIAFIQMIAFMSLMDGYPRE